MGSVPFPSVIPLLPPDVASGVGVVAGAAPLPPVGTVLIPCSGAAPFFPAGLPTIDVVSGVGATVGSVPFPSVIPLLPPDVASGVGVIAGPAPLFVAVPPPLIGVLPSCTRGVAESSTVAFVGVPLPDFACGTFVLVPDALPDADAPVTVTFAALIGLFVAVPFATGAPAGVDAGLTEPEPVVTASGLTTFTLFAPGVRDSALPAAVLSTPLALIVVPCAVLAAFAEPVAPVAVVVAVAVCGVGTPLPVGTASVVPPCATVSGFTTPGSELSLLPWRPENTDATRPQKEVASGSGSSIAATGVCAASKASGVMPTVSPTSAPVTSCSELPSAKELYAIWPFSSGAVASVSLAVASPSTMVALPASPVTFSEAPVPSAVPFGNCPDAITWAASSSVRLPFGFDTM